VPTISECMLLQSLSGMTLDEACVGDYKELQAFHKFKFITFGISKNSICTLKKSPATDYAEFIKELPPDQCRYAVYDLDFEKADGGRRNKIVFILWCVSCLEFIVPLPLLS
jgi:cofilin